MRRGTIVAIAAAGITLIASIHPTLKYFEAKNLSRIPQLVEEAKQTSERVREYFSDGFITPEESNDLYQICINVWEDRILHNSEQLITRQGNRITLGLYYIRDDFRPERTTINVEDETGRTYPVTSYVKDVSDSDLYSRIDGLLGDYISYLESEEFRNFVEPMNLKERLALHAVLALND